MEAGCVTVFLVALAIAIVTGILAFNEVISTETFLKIGLPAAVVAALLFWVFEGA